MTRPSEENWIWFFQCRLLRPFDAEAMRTAREDMIEACRRQGIPKELAWDLAAAADELSCNVLEHSAAEWMDFGLAQEAATGMLRLRMLDNGERFDVALAMTRAEEAAGDGNARHLGLGLIKTVSKHIDYRRTDEGANELVLSVR